MRVRVSHIRARARVRLRVRSLQMARRLASQV